MAPDVPAPAPQGPPTNPDQALEIVRSRYAQPKLPDGTSAELHMRGLGGRGAVEHPAPGP